MTVAMPRLNIVPVTPPTTAFDVEWGVGSATARVSTRSDLQKIKSHTSGVQQKEVDIQNSGNRERRGGASGEAENGESGGQTHRYRNRDYGDGAKMKCCRK